MPPALRRESACPFRALYLIQNTAKHCTQKLPRRCPSGLGQRPYTSPSTYRGQRVEMGWKRHKFDVVASHDRQQSECANIARLDIEALNTLEALWSGPIGELYCHSLVVRGCVCGRKEWKSPTLLLRDCSQLPVLFECNVCGKP